MKIMWFCIPAFGHTNPTIEVVRELVRRGHEVRYYSFEMFREKIIDTGAEYIACDEYLMKPDRKLEEALKRSSTTAMSLNAIETTIRMNDRLTKDVTEYQPDLIVSDSVCFWGKLLAEKYQIPLVCSTTTFAFNQYSSRYMKYSFHEICDTILGSGKVKKALKQLEPLGYHVKNALELVQNRNNTDTIVYASKKFQPFSDTFDAEHYCFAGPSVRDIPISRSDSQRPLIYISLGTVVSDHPDFYRNCIQGLQDIDMDVLISCGSYVDMSIFSDLPANIRAERRVDQLEILSHAHLFLTHCGMNSASEGLYMGVPELLFPQTGEQKAVARRVSELGAGMLLTPVEAKTAERIHSAVLKALNDSSLRAAAEELRRDFTQSGGYRCAADFIEARLQH